MECKNCQEPLDPIDNFCKRCGARIVNQVITFRYLANEMSERFFNIENNLILRTIKDLSFRPKQVIEGYLNGVRKRHLQVANYLALAITISGLQIFLMKKFFQESFDMSWMLVNNNPALENTEVLEATWEYQSILYVLFIPIIALVGRIIFFNYKKFSYLHHLVISTYTQAHLSICLFLPTIILLALGMNFFKLTYFLIFPLMIVYSSFVYKQLYQLSFGKLILKILLFILVIIIAYFLIGITVFLFWLVTGTVDIEEMIKAQQSAGKAVSYIASSLKNWTS